MRARFLRGIKINGPLCCCGAGEGPVGQRGRGGNEKGRCAAGHERRSGQLRSCLLYTSLYWEKAAYEEAEHASKFAELLGEDLEPNMKACTKSNLAWRVDCEYGATKGKFDLAACAKKNGLDAIHDTVHEMARDEARHGKALEGLLKRYFG